MQISEFKGIQQFHDGRPVTDYCNMIPMGNSVIDREGETINYMPGSKVDYDNEVLETFVDSQQHIYVATRTRVYRYIYYPSSDTSERRLLLDSVSNGYNPTGNVTFCESSTKPGMVFCCDGHRVWYWNIENITATTGTQIDSNHSDWYESFSPRILPIFDTDKILKTNLDSAIRNVLSDTQPNDTTGSFDYYNCWWDVDDFKYGENLSNTKIPLLDISSITWFDNRLICIQKSKNTVWLSDINIAKYLQPKRLELNSNASAAPSFPFSYDETQSTWINDFMPHYYSSTASSAKLDTAIAFAGQLYFLNDTSIELWSATGNDSNPIQHNSQQTLYYGGRSPLIIEDNLYLICTSPLHSCFIAAINQTGGIQRISNEEIEQRIKTSAYRLRPINTRDTSMVAVVTDRHYNNAFVFTRSGFWWRFDNNNNNHALAWSIGYIESCNLGISRYAHVIRTSADFQRKYGNGQAIPRYIIGGFMQFIGRKILRELQIICDTGIYLDPGNSQNYKAGLDERHQYFLRVSFDRGLSFGPYLYRKAGASGKNDRVISWRNCGSGNSILLHFGTSDNLKFQIYGLNIETN